MSMQWEVFGWPQKVMDELDITLFPRVSGWMWSYVRISHMIVAADHEMDNKVQLSVKA